MSDSISSDEVKHGSPRAPTIDQRRVSNLYGPAKSSPRPCKDVEALEPNDVEPMSYPLPIENTMRKDIPNPMLKPSIFTPSTSSRGWKILWKILVKKNE